MTRPLVMPGIVTGATFAFITSFDEIVCVIFLGSPEFRTLPRQIWSGAKETVSPTITVAAVFLVVASVVLTLVVEALRRRTQKTDGSKAAMTQQTASAHLSAQNGLVGFQDGEHRLIDDGVVVVAR